MSKICKAHHSSKTYYGLGLGLLLCLQHVSASAQEAFVPMDELTRWRLLAYGVNAEAAAHTSCMPYYSYLAPIGKVPGLGQDSTAYPSKFAEKLFSGHLLELRKENFSLRADLLLHLSYGRQLQPSSAPIWQNTRGIALSGQLGSHVYFYTDVRENQAFFPEYLSRFADSTGVIPGSGRTKAFNTDGYDFNMATGYISIRASDQFQLDFGHGKHFLGTGRRSLLLSDNAFNYPFASANLRSSNGEWALRYTLALLQRLERLPLGEAPEAIFKRKYLSWSYLSYKPSARLELGLAATAVYAGFDDSTGTLALPASALLPVPGLSTAVEGWRGERVSTALGINMAYYPLRELVLYGQVRAEGTQAQQLGAQVGVQRAGLFQFLDLRLEYNHLGSQLYTSEQPLTNFSHFGQPLAHPMLHGINEWIGTLQARKGRWLARYHTVLAKGTAAKAAEAYLTSGSTLWYQQLYAAYVFNPTTNLQLYISFVNRTDDVPSGVGQNQFVEVGLRTQLTQRYLDF